MAVESNEARDRIGRRRYLLLCSAAPTSAVASMRPPTPNSSSAAHSPTRILPHTLTLPPHSPPHTPAHQVSADETERLIKMEEVLHGRVIGQVGLVGGRGGGCGVQGRGSIHALLKESKA